MGQMRFVAPHPERLAETAAELAYVAGIEGVPWRCRSSLVTATADRAECRALLIERTTKESGNLCLPWRVQGHGELILATASLMERSKPYNLPVELARGAVVRLRNQLAEWQMCGLEVPAATLAAAKHAEAAFSRAVTSGSELAASELAEGSLRLAVDAAVLLVDQYSQQLLSARHQQSGPLPSLLGGCLPMRPLSDAEAQPLADAWNAAVVPFPWYDIERSGGQFQWAVCDRLLQECQARGWTVLGGPLLHLSRRHLPDWVYLWEDDFEQFQACVIQFVRATVQRYRGQVHIWHCAARANMDGAISLSEEQRLRLVVTVMEEVRHADPQTPILVAFDQPWAEYLATTTHELSPLHFADSLVRAELGLAGVGLELNIGHWPGASRPRDLIELSRQLDRWSLLGLPLFVFLSLDARDEYALCPDLQASRPTGPDETESHPGASPSRVQTLLPLVLAKHFVQGLFWSEFCDADRVEFAGSGLFDRQRQPTPLVELLASIRRQHLA